MEKVIINRNTPVMDVEVLNAAPVGRIVNIDETPYIRITCPKHHLREGDKIYFRKVSGTGDTSTWGVYGEAEVEVASIIDKDTFVVPVPVDAEFYKIVYADGDEGTISTEQNYPLLPEDFNEIWIGNGIVMGVLKDYNDEASDTELGPFYPVYRKKATRSGDEYNPNYDRNDINTHTFSVINGLEQLPTVTTFTYSPYVATAESEVLVAVRVDRVPSQEEITEESPEKIYTYECDDFDGETYAFYQKTQNTLTYDYSLLEDRALIINYNPYFLMTNNYEAGQYVKMYNSTQIVRKHRYYSVDLGFSTTDEHNLLQQNTIENFFGEEVKADLLPDILDMEKVMFEPCYTSGDTKVLLDQISFVFHFRYRKVLYKKLEDIPSYVYDQAVPMRNMPVISDTECQPFATSASRTQPLYAALTTSTSTEYYQRVYDDGWYINEDFLGWNYIRKGTPWSGLTMDANKFTRSDLMGYLDFNDDDIRYQKEKVKQTFVRLSFYDSPNPLDQQLLGFSTIFVDTGDLAGKYFRNKAMYSLNRDIYNIYIEPMDPRGGGYETDSRIGSGITVKNKFDTENSSEGFYIYLFKNEVDEETPEKIVYMKVDYNHAGNGRSIPFTRPKFVPYEGFGKISDMNFDEYYDYLYVKLKLKYNADCEPHYTYEFITPENTPSESKEGVTDSAYGVSVNKDSKSATIILFEPLFGNGDN